MGISRDREIDETSGETTDDTMPAELGDEVPLPTETGDYPDGEGGAGDSGEGFITVMRFRVILKEIDEEFTEDELDEIIAEIDTDKSDTIDFNEFVKIMT